MREQSTQRLLKLTSLVTFLFSDKKVTAEYPFAVEKYVSLCYNNRKDILKEATLCCLKPFSNE